MISLHKIQSYNYIFDPPPLGVNGLEKCLSVCLTPLYLKN